MDIKEYLVEKLKQAPKIIAVTLGISVILGIMYVVIITLVNVTYMM